MDNTQLTYEGTLKLKPRQNNKNLKWYSSIKKETNKKDQVLLYQHGQTLSSVLIGIIDLCLTL